MGLELPKGNIFVPEVPDSIKAKDTDLYSYLQKLKRSVEDLSQGGFTNSMYISTAINSGTSGTFTLSSGGSIIITSGIVIRVTS